MLNERQYEQLLKPLNQARVEKRSAAGRSLSYLAAWDVKAHLIRIFGFGGWSADVIDATLCFEDEIESSKGSKQWHVAYKVQMTLRIPTLQCSYTEVAVGAAKLPDRGEAHDMAVKTAESDALKRAAINLGTQFGLSLYDNGSTQDVIKVTLDTRNTVLQTPAQQGDEQDVQKNEAPAKTEVVIKDSEGAAIWYEQIKAVATDTETSAVERLGTLVALKKQIMGADAGTLLYNGSTLDAWVDRAAASVTASTKKNGESK